MIRKIKDREIKEGEQLITKFIVKQEEKKINTPKKKGERGRGSYGGFESEC